MIYLETERLVLRDWREEDSVVFSRMNRDPKVMEYFLKPLTDTESRDFYERIRREIDTFGWGLFAAEVKISGNLSVISAYIIRILKQIFVPVSRSVGAYAKTPGDGDMLPKVPGLVWIMLSGNYNYRRFIPLLLYPTDAPKG